MTMVTTKGIHNFHFKITLPDCAAIWVTCICHHWYKIWCKFKDN